MWKLAAVVWNIFEAWTAFVQGGLVWSGRTMAQEKSEAGQTVVWSEATPASVATAGAIYGRNG
jgi:hypothetical protein